MDGYQNLCALHFTLTYCNVSKFTSKKSTFINMDAAFMAMMHGSVADAPNVPYMAFKQNEMCHI